AKGSQAAPAAGLPYRVCLHALFLRPLQRGPPRRRQASPGPRPGHRGRKVLPAGVLLQSEWEEQGARISYNLERRFSHVQENSESLQRPGEGRHTSAPSPRTHPGFGSVRPARHSPHDVLPLAEGVLRERRCRIRALLPPPQRRQGPEDHPAGTKAATQARSPLRTHGGTYQTKKRTWGTLNGAWVPQSIRDAVVQFVQRWAGRTNLPILLLAGWLGIAMSKFSRWSGRLGTPNQHNASLPRDFWLEDWEKAAIIAFHALYPLEGYRLLAYMMLDADVVAVSPSSVYRVLRAAGKLAPRGGASLPRRDRASSSPCGLMSTGTSMSPISTSAGPSSSCAA